VFWEAVIMLLIFDCDGVLIDSMSLHNQVESEAYRQMGIVIEPRELGRRFAGMPMREAFTVLEKEFGISIPAGFEEMLEEKKTEVFSKSLAAMEGIHETLDALEKLPRCIASGSRIQALQDSLKIVNLYERFAPHVFSSQMVVRGKPHPDLFLYAAEKMKIAPDECLVIEDAVAGVTAARAANMRVFGFVGGAHCGESHANMLLEAGAEKVFSRINELPGLILTGYP
jgi:HAD superfamily hydrolase (TIGR01509 family)